MLYWFSTIIIYYRFLFLISDDTSSLQSSHNIKASTTGKKTSSGSSGTTPHSSSTATDPSSQHSHESGFQSAASLNSLDKNQNIGRGKSLGKYSSAIQSYRAQDLGNEKLEIFN